MAMGAAMVAIGSGLGIFRPHLGTHVFAAAAVDERELASASITFVAMVANALGSASGGLLTNMAGLTAPGGMLGASAAASWLYGAFQEAPVLAFLVIRRLRRVEVAAA